MSGLYYTKLQKLPKFAECVEARLMLKKKKKLNSLL